MLAVESPSPQATMDVVAIGSLILASHAEAVGIQREQGPEICDATPGWSMISVRHGISKSRPAHNKLDKMFERLCTCVPFRHMACNSTCTITLPGFVHRKIGSCCLIEAIHSVVENS